jgi:hypothetical protein
MMNRIKRTTLTHISGRVDARNYMVALGPNYDPARDIVVVTVRYHHNHGG